MKRWFITLILFLFGQSLFGQMFPERRDLRQGNREYKRENYVEAEARYRNAVSKNGDSYEGHFNMGSAYYKQGRYEEAEQYFQALGQVPYLPEQWAQTLYNQGNAQVQQYKSTYDREKLKQALEAYKQSLRINPDDQQAKFNLAYVQKLLEQESGENESGGDGENDQDQNDDSQNQGSDQPDPSSDNTPSEGDGQQPPPEGRMSREEAERMLNAMQGSEDQAREKADKQEGVVVRGSGKNW